MLRSTTAVDLDKAYNTKWEGGCVNKVQHKEVVYDKQKDFEQKEERLCGYMVGMVGTCVASDYNHWGHVSSELSICAAAIDSLL